MTEEKIAETVAKSVKAAFGEFAPKSPAVRAELELPRIKTYGRLKNFTHDDACKLGAFRFGTWCMAAMGHKKSAEFCAKSPKESPKDIPKPNPRRASAAEKRAVAAAPDGDDSKPPPAKRASRARN